jgi:amidase
MVDGEGYGHNWDGLYDPELVAFYGRKRREVVDEWSPTVKAVALTGRWSIERLYTVHYAMARNLGYEVRRRYDEALTQFDVLVMPTLPFTATPLVEPSDPIELSVTRALEVIANTAQFDIGGHPAISVPAGLVDGLPVGMQIVGRRFNDATCLQVAHAFEQIRGDFPRPPATTGALT